MYDQNREAVWIDPMDYQAEGTQAVLELRDWRMDVSPSTCCGALSQKRYGPCLQIHIRLENPIPRYLSGMC